ncbi:MAG: glycosyltransferase, partial [Deltaproteobacteria bacterium]|nr:glycosyltransferase [Deltaproteobacteria bacterium]
MDLSIVVPVYNEEESVEPLLREVLSALDPLGKSYEIILVDDGSTDGTPTLLSRLHQSERRITVLRFKRNFGQTAAIAAGLAHARG